MTAAPESAEDFYARVEMALDDERRLPVAIEEMPGWDIFPFEVDSLRIKPLQRLADEEPPRRGEDPGECWCASPLDTDDPGLVWYSDRWKLVLAIEGSGLPVMLWLSPLQHMDLTSMQPAWAAEFGVLTAAISAQIEALPSVGRAQIAKYGDGGAHLHLLLMGRPARMLQLRGSPLLDWEENLPRVPESVLRANVRPIVEALVEEYGGTGRLV